MADTREFERVLVIDAGRVVEDGRPDELERNPQSRYASLARSDRDARHELWNARQFRRQVVREGRVLEPEQA